MISKCCCAHRQAPNIIVLFTSVARFSIGICTMRLAKVVHAILTSLNCALKLRQPSRVYYCCCCCCAVALSGLFICHHVIVGRLQYSSSVPRAYAQTLLTRHLCHRCMLLWLLYVVYTPVVHSDPRVHRIPVIPTHIHNFGVRFAKTRWPHGECRRTPLGFILVAECNFYCIVSI